MYFPIIATEHSATSIRNIKRKGEREAEEEVAVYAATVRVLQACTYVRGYLAYLHISAGRAYVCRELANQRKSLHV